MRKYNSTAFAGSRKTAIAALMDLEHYRLYWMNISAKVRKPSSDELYILPHYKECSKWKKIIKEAQQTGKKIYFRPICSTKFNKI